MSRIEKILFPQHSNGVDPKALVNARELHSYLENRQEFRQWLEREIKECGFAPHKDFKIVHTTTPNGTSVEYYLTLDMARELVILEPNDKGKRARLHYIECESRTKNPILDFDDLVRRFQLGEPSHDSNPGFPKKPDSSL